MTRNISEKTALIPVSRRKFLRLTGLGLGGLALGNAFLREPTAVSVEETAFVSSKIPAGKTLRVVQLSDLHIRKFQSYFLRVAHTANSLKPDIILLTGDYIEESRNLPGALKFLKLLKAPLGLFAVQGNWEYWARIEGEGLRRHFASTGVKLLINQRQDIEAGDIPISVLGLDYPSTENALSSLQNQADPSRINLLLSHVPAFNHEGLEAPVDLVCCGHTHGGQVRLPALPPLYLPRYSDRFVSGLFQVGPHQTPLYVSRGIGTSILPVRFFCRPEITLFTLSGPPVS